MHIGSHLGNNPGAYDILEWCQDVYNEEFYSQCQKQGVVENPLNLEGNSSKVVRGGASASFRGRVGAAYYLPRFIGFRTVFAFPTGR